MGSRFITGVNTVCSSLLCFPGCYMAFSWSWLKSRRHPRHVFSFDKSPFCNAHASCIAFGTQGELVSRLRKTFKLEFEYLPLTLHALCIYARAVTKIILSALMAETSTVVVRDPHIWLMLRSAHSDSPLPRQSLWPVRGTPFALKTK